MWFHCTDIETCSTPAIAVYPERIRDNIQQTLALVGGKADRLCPHIKTHKCRRILELFAEKGITQFKCATIDELNLLVQLSTTSFALLAKQPFGPDLEQVVSFAAEHPSCNVATIVDNDVTLSELISVVQRQDIQLEVLIDINNGMNRTGIRVSESAFELYRKLSESTVLRPGGLHIYDGHIHDSDIALRRQNVEDAMKSVLVFRDRLQSAGYPVPRLITGGTPSFPIHAQDADRICSPEQRRCGTPGTRTTIQVCRSNQPRSC